MADWILKLPMKEIIEVSRAYNLPGNLLAAIIQKESSGNVNAIRFEPAYKYFWDAKDNAQKLNCSLETELTMQACSIGLTQVMGAVCREYGFKGWLSELFQVKLNLQYGAKHLQKYVKKHSFLNDAIAAYNAGSPRLAAGGKYVNQAYVDGVLSNKAELDKKIVSS